MSRTDGRVPDHTGSESGSSTCLYLKIVLVIGVLVLRQLRTSPDVSLITPQTSGYPKSIDHVFEPSGPPPRRYEQGPGVYLDGGSERKTGGDRDLCPAELGRKTKTGKFELWLELLKDVGGY